MNFFSVIKKGERYFMTDNRVIDPDVEEYGNTISRAKKQPSGTVIEGEGDEPDRFAQDVNMVNSNITTIPLALKTTYTGTSTTTETVTGKAIGIWNRGNTDLTLTINDIDVVVEPDVILGPELLNFGSFTSVLVTASGAWQLFIYE